MDMIEAMEKRVSCRAFTDKPVPPEITEQLAAEIERVNAEAGLHFQLYGPREGGTAIDMSPKMFASNPPWYMALVGPKGEIPEEKLGYYGEKLVMMAECQGISTCWVASTYDHDTVRAELAEGEVLHDVVPFGYAPKKVPLKQRTIRAGIRKRSKSLDELYRGSVPLAQAAEWVQACIDAVWKAPSAINEQPVVFVQESIDGPVRAELSRVKTGMEYTDLGIAKYHFEVVAGACGVKGTWDWGVGGAYNVER